jgi:hypothetical protein
LLGRWLTARCHRHEEKSLVACVAPLPLGSYPLHRKVLTCQVGLALFQRPRRDRTWQPRHSIMSAQLDMGVNRTAMDRIMAHDRFRYLGLSLITVPFM